MAGRMKTDAMEALARQERARRASSFEPEKMSSRRNRVSSFDESSTVNYSNSSHQANALAAVTVPHVFRNAVNIRGQMQYIVEEDGKALTVLQFYELACNAGKSLIKMGLQRYQGVAVLSKNDIPWFVSSVSTIFAGGVSVGISRGSSSSIVRHILTHANAFAIVTDDVQTVLNVEGQVPVQNIILTNPGDDALVRERFGDDSKTKLYSWQEFLEFGADLPDETLAQTMEEQKPEECCTLMYTSGTTGLPKAVMLSHDNITWTMKVVGQTLRLDGTDVGLSFLPLSHIAASLVDIHGAIQLGLTMHLVDTEMSGSAGFKAALKRVEPTFLIGVPAVWEKLHSALEKGFLEKSRLRQKFATMAMEIGAKTIAAEEQKKKKPWNFSLANRVVLRKVVRQLGLARCKFCMNVGAPLRRDTFEFFSALHIPILDVYGLTETTGPASVSTPWVFAKGSVGKPLNGVECIIRNPSASGEGEVLLRGRNVFVGYLGDVGATGEAVDADGYFHTGDLGKLDSNGQLFITGRIKELVVMKDGQNLSPVPAEEVLRLSVPGIAQAMLIGDGHHSIVCIFTLMEKIDEEGQNTGLLIDDAALVNLDITTIEQARTDPIWHNYISICLQKNIDAINEIANGYEVKRSA